MLEEVKKSLRILNNEFDNEIKLLIESAQEDLISSGVDSSYFTKEEVKRPLLKNAIILYCKSQFGFDNPDSEKYAQSYEHIKKKISISHNKPFKEEEEDEV